MPGCAPLPADSEPSGAAWLSPDNRLYGKAAPWYEKEPALHLNAGSIKGQVNFAYGVAAAVVTFPNPGFGEPPVRTLAGSAMW
jgi:hypothetical protein